MINKRNRWRRNFVSFGRNMQFEYFSVQQFEYAYSCEVNFKSSSYETLKSQPTTRMESGNFPWKWKVPENSFPLWLDFLSGIFRFEHDWVVIERNKKNEPNSKQCMRKMSVREREVFLKLDNLKTFLMFSSLHLLSFTKPACVCARHKKKTEN
jgi:hypothetical protein